MPKRRAAEAAGRDRAVHRQRGAGCGVGPDVCLGCLHIPQNAVGQTRLSRTPRPGSARSRAPLRRRAPDHRTSTDREPITRSETIVRRPVIGRSARWTHPRRAERSRLPPSWATTRRQSVGRSTISRMRPHEVRQPRRYLAERKPRVRAVDEQLEPSQPAESLRRPGLERYVVEELAALLEIHLRVQTKTLALIARDPSRAATFLVAVPAWARCPARGSAM